MMTIDVNAFLAFVRTLEGKEIQTRAGRSKFKVKVVSDGLEIAPQSTAKPRLHNRRYTERVLRHFQQTGSWANTDYKFTVNATYQLTLIDLYLAENITAAAAS